MLTIKNTKLFRYMQDTHAALPSFSLFQIMTDEKSEFYMPNIPNIDFDGVEIYSDRIIFYDHGYSGIGIRRDNTFKIEEE